MSPLEAEPLQMNVYISYGFIESVHEQFMPLILRIADILFSNKM